jgi:predicted PurR-regulated permease PerM
MVSSKEYMKYIFVIMFVLIIYLAYLVIRPFITALLTSAVLAYIFYPLYEAINERIKRKNVSALVVSLLIIIILAIPFTFVAGSLARESQVIYIKSRQVFTTGDIFSIGCAPEERGIGCTLSNWIGGLIRKPSVRYHIEESIGNITSLIARKTSEFVLSIPAIALNLFVAFFATFYLFKDGKSIIERIRKMLPLKLHHQKQIFQQLDETTYAIIYGSLLVAAIQGIVGGMGYYLFGISSPILWGILTAIFALLPFIGTALVWLPLSMFIVVQGLSVDSPMITLKGIGLLLFGALIISSMDNLLKPYIIGRRAKIHPVLVLIGVLGGIAFFGFIGFVIGPLVLAIFANFIDIYEKEKAVGDGLK